MVFWLLSPPASRELGKVCAVHIPFGGPARGAHWAITEAASPASVTSMAQYVAMGVRPRVSVKRSFACTIPTERK